MARCGSDCLVPSKRLEPETRSQVSGQDISPPDIASAVSIFGTYIVLTGRGSLFGAR